MTDLHSLHDGSVLRLMWAKELIHIPVWQGNRILNMDHVESIRRGVGDRVSVLDFGYRIVRSTELDATGRDVSVSWIVDGQHRHHVLRDAFLRNPELADFAVVVVEKTTKSELEIIEYFNTINAAKPIQWSDSNLVVNAYLAEFEAVFNVKKVAMIRRGATHRPYLSVDKLRAALQRHVGLLRGNVSDIKTFVEKVKRWNDRQAEIHAESENPVMKKAATLGFMLAIDARLDWVQIWLECAQTEV